jgi:phosphoribosylformimino-5-aminoimidazole carboxamide ribotide isomerase
MLLIPSIDLRGGRCVRLVQGCFEKETDYDIHPATLLRRYKSLGAVWLHIVDLDGARDGTPVNGSMIANLARHQGVQLQVGGGVRSAAVIETLFAAGVARVVIGSLAVRRPGEVLTWLKCFGAERICLAFDVRLDSGGTPFVYTHGWTRNSALPLWEALEPYPGAVLKHVLCTDISRDGTLEGPNIDLYRAALTRFPDLAWQASGGIRRAADLRALAELGVSAAVSGKALLENRIEEPQKFSPVASSPA